MKTMFSLIVEISGISTFVFLCFLYIYLSQEKFDYLNKCGVSFGDAGDVKLDGYKSSLIQLKEKLEVLTVRNDQEITERASEQERVAEEKRVAAETNHKVRIIEAYAGKIAKVHETLEAVEKGLLDIGSYCVCFGKHL